MRKFINKITPSFIIAYNERLLKNAPLGWQLQLPTITWVWFIVTVLTIPIPFFINLDHRGDDDILAVILISVLTAVLEGFLFVYILIQFNNTKTFGRRVFLNGFKEQFAYVYVFMLCMMHIIFYPLIIDIRKGNLMTAEEIRSEAVTYNQASFYFMGDPNAYRYFPTDASFLHYEYLEGRSQYDNVDYDYENETRNIEFKEAYYIEHAKPLMRAYFTEDADDIDPQYTRNVTGCPKLYMTEDNHITETYYNHSAAYQEITDTVYFERYQVRNKPDAERLKDIKAFIKLYNAYDDGYSDIRFEDPETILKNYKSNRFNQAYGNVDDISNYPVTTVDGNVEASGGYPNQLNQYRISGVHSNISEAKHYKWGHLLERLVITFYVALGFAILLFLFKNIRLREFILTFVYTGLLALAVAILSVVLFRHEAFAIHVVWAVFLLGIYFSFFHQHTHYSSLITVFVLLSNAAMACAPICMYVYFHEFLEIGQLPDEYQYCTKNPQICSDYYAMEDLIVQCCLWAGPALYLFLGSTLYKKTYERLLALPLAK